MSLFIKIIITLLLSFTIAYAQVTPKILDEIKRDYQPIAALLIGIEGNEVIIDKGRAQGVKPKDVFTVYKKSRKIIHPETKESLGFLKEPIGKIEVLRVDENFATARILSKKEDFPIPTPAKRFADLRFLITTEGNPLDEGLFITMKNLLPESEILFEPNLRTAQITSADLHAKKVDILISVGVNYIKAYNSYLDLVRAYGSPSATLALAAIPQAPQIQQPQPVVQSPQFSQVSLLGKMPGEVLQAEFADVDGDGVLEMIYFNKEGLFIVKIRGGLLAKYKPDKGDILSISTGPYGWIAINVYEKNLGMRSEVLRFTPQGLSPVVQRLNLFLQFVDYAGTGQKDTLLAQTFDQESMFGKEVYIVKRESNQIRYVSRVEVPENFRLIGANFIDLDGDGERELAYYLPDGRLTIYKGNRQVFVTPFSATKHFFRLTLAKGKKGQEVIKAVAVPLFSPLLVDLTNDGKPELLFAKVDFPLERVSEDLKTIPLNQGSFQLYYLTFQGTYVFRSLPLQETGILTGFGSKNRELFFTTVKGVFPGQTESFLYSILY
ncbi:MAG: hypothetical protein N2Z40_04680 [Caldimicrobium sp.]|nr:hypothetical protein [Caldimicrobium sp.]MCX7613499.1 hypothetical protein [Caldimicrobium sp.]MDW8182459.1 FlgT C-terminal domain-containing protein [Caldimicrobium sp.]